MAKGGRRPGAGRPVANHTIETEAAKKRLVELFVADMEPIYLALIKEAKKGNVPAIKELFERVFGKVPQAIANDGDNAFLVQWLQSPSPTIHADGPNSSTTAQSGGSV